MPRRIWLGLAILVLLLCSGLGAAATTRASDSDVSAAEDNPPGCTKATDESNHGCGAKGRDHFSNANHKPPIEACASSTAPTGSTVTRITPDGPRRADGSLAFISGACVYLPPGYDSSGLRYPVIHTFHGGGGDQADWVTFGDIRGILDRAYESDPARAAIVVMPDGRSGQFYDYENGSFLIETYILEYLVPYVDDHFRTIPDRSARAVVGLSNGGYGAMHFAGKRPDLFVTAGGMSSNLGGRTLSGLGRDGGVHHQGSVPYQLAENYDAVDVVLDVANYCTAPDPLCATIIVDLLFTPDHVGFNRRMAEIGHKGDLDFRQADGAHQFTWWRKWLEERQLPYVQQRLADPMPASATAPVSRIPPEFRYRSIKTRFSVWGYDVAVQRNVREFLDLGRVAASGFMVKGSGRARITTASYYEPGLDYTVTGVGPDPAPTTLTADADGRLSIDVDLGPSHTLEQFTNEATVAERSNAGYWTIRTVSIAQASDGQPVTAATTPPVPPAVIPVGDVEERRYDAELERRDAPTNGGKEPASGGGIAGAVRRAVAPVVSAIPGPQLAPTVLFVLALAAGPAVWWWRRRPTTENDATSGQQ